MISSFYRIMVFALAVSIQPTLAMNVSTPSLPFKGQILSLEKCIAGPLDYPVYLEVVDQCIAEQGFELADDALRFIKPSLPDGFNIERLLFSKRVAAAEGFISPLTGEATLNVADLVAKQPDWIYGLDQAIHQAAADGKVSASQQQTLLREAYGAFDPIQLAQAHEAAQSVSSSGSTGASATGGATGAAGSGSAATAAGGGSLATFGMLTYTLATKEDSPPQISLSLSETSAIESANPSITVTATANQVVGADVTVNLSITGTATAASDYTLTSTVTIPSGLTTGTATLAILNDSATEGDETVIVSIASVEGDEAETSGATSGTVTIIDDESTPVLTLTTGSSSIAENAGSSITLTATASVAPSANVTVSLSASGTATSGTDYGAVSSITILSGQTTGTASFTPTDDSIYEGNETAIFVVSTVSGGDSIENGNQSVTLTITEDDSAPTVTLTSSAASVAENGSALTLTATLSNATTEDVTVSLATTGTGTSGTDYTAGSDITISAGNLTGTTSFTPTDDSVYEGDETAIVAIDSVSGGSTTESGSQTVTITISENESAPTVTLSAAASSVSEDASSGLTLTATLSVATTAGVTVTLSASGTATSGTDYATLSNITVSAGETTGTTTLTPTDDSTFEGDETVIIDIGSVSGGSATENGTQQVTITLSEDDAGPSASVAAVTVDEGDGTATVTVTLSEASGVISTVDYALTPGTATPGSDYTDISGTLTFPAGDVSESFTVIIGNDSLDEDNETFTVTLSSASQISLGTPSATVTITDDDATPSLSIADAATDDESTAKVVTVTLSAASGRDVSVVYASANGSATAGSDYTAVSGTLTISAGNTTGSITVTPSDDSVYEDDETLTIALSSPTNASISDGSATVTITEDESAPTITLSGGASISESAGSSVTLTATLSVAADEDVSVTLTKSGTSESDDYSLSASTITVAALGTTGTTTVTPVNDSMYEGSETVILAVTGVSGGGATESGAQSETVTITDDESVPTFTMSIPETTVAEDGPSSTITVTMSGTAEADATVTLSGSGTATAGTDYAALSSVSITSGNTTGSATFDPTTDSLDEASETAIITISAISLGSASPTTGSSDSITITDVALNSGTTESYDSAQATTNAADVEYTQIDLIPVDDGTFQSPALDSPYDNINLPQAHAYGLTGSGETIAIVDNMFLVNGFGASSTHQELNGKTINTYGSAVTYNAASDHGTGVAGVAAADDDGIGIIGVAPGAALHLSSFASDFQPTHWANATAAAQSAGAVVQNNSWGFDEQYGAAGADVFVTYKSTNSLTGAETLVAFQSIDTDGDGNYDVGAGSTPKTWTAANWNTYVAALDSYQSQGVIVFALSNDSSKTNADISAALPALFPELNEAWITAANVNIGLSSGSKTYTLESAPCGVTAAYCLSADGYAILVPGGSGLAVGFAGTTTVNSGTSAYALTSGSSFAAPQVSGAVALLAEAFPNHSPEKLVDRLLASADNSIAGFSSVGVVTFGNGVQHSYDENFGHGIMDVYAALQPITTSMVRMMTGDSVSTAGLGTVFTLQESVLRSAVALGNALKLGLKGENGYVYDDLDGGFAYDIDQHIALQPDEASTIQLSDGMQFLKSSGLQFKTDVDAPISGFVTGVDTEQRDVGVTVGSQALPVQRLFDGVSMSAGDLDVSYLEESAGMGVASSMQLGANTRLSIGATNPMDKNDEEAMGDRRTIAAAFETTTQSTASALMVGVTQEHDNLLGSKGSGAFSLEGTDAETLFVGVRNNWKFDDSFYLEALATVGNTSLTKPKQGLVEGAESVKSLSWNLGLTTTDVFGDDLFNVSVSQPNRVFDGTMTFRLPNLADSDGNITYRNKTIDLAPSGRQMDFTIGYRRRIGEDSSVAVRHMVSSEPNHDADASDMKSSFIGFAKGGFEMGIVTRHGYDENEAQLKYSVNF